jgi:hypothetical protein
VDISTKLEAYKQEQNKRELKGKLFLLCLWKSQKKIMLYFLVFAYVAGENLA